MRYCVVTSISMVTVFGGVQGDLEEGWMFGKKKMVVGDIVWQNGGPGNHNCFHCQVIFQN